MERESNSQDVKKSIILIMDKWKKILKKEAEINARSNTIDEEKGEKFIGRSREILIERGI